MCGIAGLFKFSSQDFSREKARKVAEALSHRGPDGEGIFENENVFLLHRRLSIIDLSERSRQPAMHEPTGSALILNGEIYNFGSLRASLEKHGERFESQGDAEVLLRGLILKGMDFLSQVDGDFAFAFWDGARRRLLLARDRFGIKPLYYAFTAAGILFSSEIKGLLAAGYEPKLCKSALGEHLRFRYVQGQQTLFEGVRSLPPGHCGEIGIGETRDLQLHRYWSINPSRFQYGSYADGLEQLGALWDQAIKTRLRSDVPVGALLSGGIDSGFLASSMHLPGATAVTYDMPGQYSEVSAAREIALQSQMRQSVVKHNEEAMRLLPQVIRALEEPLGDSIVVPTFELFKEAGSTMKVVLSGEGADEVFAGYAHQQALNKLFTLEKMGLKGALSILAKAPSPLLSALAPYPTRFGGELAKRATQIFAAKNPRQQYDLSRALYDSSDLNELLTPEFSRATETLPWPKSSAPLEQVLISDLSSWLPNYGLLRVDKLSMAHGLECRVPYLQHEFAEAALSLTLCEASHAATLITKPKKVLRDLALRRFGNVAFAKRKKQPFFMPPLATRSRALQELIERYLTPSVVAKHGVFEAKAVQSALSDTGFIAHKKMTGILHVQIWLEEFGV